MRWRSTRRSRLIDTSTAETLGTVAGMVIDIESKKITSIVVDGASAPIVDFAALSSVGKDAITLDDSGSLRAPTTDIEAAAVKGDHMVIGKSVYTDAGVALGAVADVDFDPDSGRINSLTLASDEMPAGRLIGIGSFAVVVRAGSNSSGVKNGELLDELTKDELYEIARERDLEGRSTMTKAQLMEALR